MGTVERQRQALDPFESSLAGCHRGGYSATADSMAASPRSLSPAHFQLAPPSAAPSAPTAGKPLKDDGGAPKPHADSGLSLPPPGADQVMSLEDPMRSGPGKHRSGRGHKGGGVTEEEADAGSGALPLHLQRPFALLSTSPLALSPATGARGHGSASSGATSQRGATRHPPSPHKMLRSFNAPATSKKNAAPSSSQQLAEGAGSQAGKVRQPPPLQAAGAALVSGRKAHAKKEAPIDEPQGDCTESPLQDSSLSLPSAGISYENRCEAVRLQLLSFGPFNASPAPLPPANASASSKESPVAKGPVADTQRPAMFPKSASTSDAGPARRRPEAQGTMQEKSEAPRRQSLSLGTSNPSPAPFKPSPAPSPSAKESASSRERPTAKSTPDTQGPALFPKSASTSAVGPARKRPEAQGTRRERYEAPRLQPLNLEASKKSPAPSSWAKASATSKQELIAKSAAETQVRAMFPKSASTSAVNQGRRRPEVQGTSRERCESPRLQSLSLGPLNPSPAQFNPSPAPSSAKASASSKQEPIAKSAADTKVPAMFPKSASTSDVGSGRRRPEAQGTRPERAGASLPKTHSSQALAGQGGSKVDASAKHHPCQSRPMAPRQHWRAAHSDGAVPLQAGPPVALPKSPKSPRPLRTRNKAHPAPLLSCLGSHETCPTVATPDLHESHTAALSDLERGTGRSARKEKGAGQALRKSSEGAAACRPRTGRVYDDGEGSQSGPARPGRADADAPTMRWYGPGQAVAAGQARLSSSSGHAQRGPQWPQVEGPGRHSSIQASKSGEDTAESGAPWRVECTRKFLDSRAGSGMHRHTASELGLKVQEPCLHGSADSVSTGHRSQARRAGAGRQTRNIHAHCNSEVDIVLASKDAMFSAEGSQSGKSGREWAPRGVPTIGIDQLLKESTALAEKQRDAFVPFSSATASTPRSSKTSPEDSDAKWAKRASSRGSGPAEPYPAPLSPKDECGAPAPQTWDRALLTRNVLGKGYSSIGQRYVVSQEELGVGQFGVIRKCWELRAGDAYACKTLSKDRIQEPQDADDIRREVFCLARARGHSGVVQLRHTFEDEEAVHIVMELCKGGDLFDLLSERRYLEEEEASRMCRGLVTTLQGLHRMGIMHRDVKPENILLRTPNTTASPKLADFGVSTTFQPGVPIADVAGTCEYLALEVLEERSGPEADIWGAGVVLYLALSGVQPFWASCPKRLAHKILNSEPKFSSQRWGQLSEHSKDLVHRMLTKDPQQRISAAEVLAHPFILEHDA